MDYQGYESDVLAVMEFLKRFIFIIAHYINVVTGP